MDNSKIKFKGTLIVKLPDDTYNSSTNQIIINSNSKTCFELVHKFEQILDKIFKNFNLSIIKPDFLKPTCTSGYCENPVITLAYSFDKTSFIKPKKFEKVPVKNILVFPRVSMCNPIPSMNKFCEYKGKKFGCIECENPFIQLITQVAKNMAASEKEKHKDYFTKMIKKIICFRISSIQNHI